MTAATSPPTTRRGDSFGAPSLVRRSLGHYKRAHLGVIAGVAVAAAALTGALLVGDSVRGSLREQALARIGRAHSALVGGERFFRAALADDLARTPDAPETFAPALVLSAVVSASGGEARAAGVQVVGAGERFFALSPAGTAGEPVPARGEAWINERLARQLGAAAGDELVARIELPSAMPRDLVLAVNDELARALRVRVTRVLDDAHFGRFGLASTQVPPFGLFVDLAWLQSELELEGRANLVVSSAPAAAAEAALARAWTLADVELETLALDAPAEGVVALRSRRVFLDAPIGDAVGALELPLLGVFTYFVNELRAGERATPYSMVAALGALGGEGERPPHVAGALALEPDEALVNAWLARDLDAQPGDALGLAYWVMGDDRRLREERRTLRVAGVVPLEGVADDPQLMPDFPGLSDVDDCREWESGVPIELDRIRDEDETYWDQHRGAPKVFVGLAAGRAMWSNRFGDLTEVRVAAERADELRAGLRAALHPAALGLSFRDVRGPALAAGSPATDFGGLFLGLSVFLIAAALILTVLLFALGIEQRAREIGLLLAVGLRARDVRGLFLLEAVALALWGSLLGALAGAGYTRLLLAGLGSIWSGAVAGAEIRFHASGTSLTAGAAGTFLVALLAIAWSLRRYARVPAVALLGARGGVAPSTGRRARPRRAALVAGVLLVAAVALAFFGAGAGGAAASAAGAFFAAGALLLGAGLVASRALLGRLDAPGAGAPRSLAALARRNVARRPGRSLATIGLIASGVFLVVAVGANRLGGPDDPTERSSGTGGFALLARSSVPVVHDLESERGREAFALDAERLRGASFVSMRVRDGDEASCLNLGVPTHPRLLGVDPAELGSRGAFAFADVLPPDGAPEPEDPWSLLAAEYGPDVVPAVGDAASIRWTMHKSLGDELAYTDERGRPLRVKLVGALSGSILQDSLVVAEERFVERFPSASGYRAFLVDAPPAAADEVAAELSRGLADVGLEVVPAARRLAELFAVQNGYLAIFQVLGALGLLLGSVGLGVVVLRNALERRAELAALRALGFPLRLVRRALAAEHAWLLAAGLGVGVVAAAVAVLPAAREAGSGTLLGVAALVVLAVAASAALWVALAARVAMRGGLVEALRDE